MAKNCLIIIDPQNDFCAAPRPDLLNTNISDPTVDEMARGGSLYVPGADQDMIRLAGFIERNIPAIDEIFVTLDSHHTWSIYHSMWWKGRDGKHPDPFTPITLADIEAGVWRCTIPRLQKASENYARELEKSGKFVLVIWPNHCRIGTFGHNVYPPLMSALTNWEYGKPGNIGFKAKGTNPLTEHYGVFAAEVEMPNDPGTQTDFETISRIESYDNIFFTGQALSHCVAESLRGLMKNISDEACKRIHLIRDCTSNVPGFEAQGQEAIDEAVAKGVKIIDSSYMIS